MSTRTRGADLVTLFSKRHVHFHFANHFTHRRFSRLNHGGRGILALEQVGARIVQAVLHGKLDLDNVLVFGQHGRIAQAGCLEDGVTAYIDRTDLRHHHDFVALYRIRQTPVETGAHR